MRDGLFKQYFLIFMVTLLTCTALLGLALLAFTGVNYSAQRQQLLAGIVDNAIALTEKSWSPGGFTGPSMLSLGAHTGDASEICIYITDVSGKIQECSEEECHHGEKAPDHAVDQGRPREADGRPLAHEPRRRMRLRPLPTCRGGGVDPH